MGRTGDPAAEEEIIGERVTQIFEVIKSLYSSDERAQLLLYTAFAPACHA
jgi:hypothetical protein